MALHDINIALHFEKIILIKDGNIIGLGRPDDVLSRRMLKQTFDVDIEVKKLGSDGIYISCENNC